MSTTTAPARPLADLPALGPAARRRRRLARRWLCAGLVAGAGAVAVSALAPPAPVTAPVLVAVHDLPAGSPLGPADVREVRWPRDAVPSGVLTPGDLDGVRLAGPLRRGEAVTDTRTAGAGLLAGQPPGTLAASVEAGEATSLAGLGPGARVDVLARTDDPLTGEPVGAERIAADVVVLAVPTATGGGGLLGSGGPGGTSVLLAVDARTAAALTGAAGRTVVALRAP